MDTETDKKMRIGEMDRNNDGPTKRMDIKTHTDRCTDRHTDEQTEGQTVWKTDVQMEK